MNESAAGALLSLESLVLQNAGPSIGVPRDLFVSVNPDLVTDFGHYLNYEKRLAEACQLHGLDYACLGNSQARLDYPGLVPIFERDSGHYSLTRASVSGQEDRVVDEFQGILLAAVYFLRQRGDYRRIHLFMYCGSSRLAVRLSERRWAPSLNLCINAFWDFLLVEPTPAGLPQLRFQRVVHLLAMSDLHAKRWHMESGLPFCSIPNPPPLLSDHDAYQTIRQRVCSRRSAGPLRVLVPGLMSLGKGRESTQALLDHLHLCGTGGCEYVIRDRMAELNCGPVEQVRIITGDLSDMQVIALYREADVVLLPYEADVFAVRTSGALVDALVFGAVPLVLEGTWLAHQCRLCEVGQVLADAAPRTIVDAVSAVGADIERARQRVPRAASLYLARNNWSELLDSVILNDDCSEHPLAPDESGTTASLLAAANRLLREGQFASAAQLYTWLQTASPRAVYATYLKLCARRSGQSIDELLSIDL